MPNRRYSFPNGHWNWPVQLTHHHAVRAGDLIFTGGQVDLTPEGVVRNIGDLHSQTANSMQYMAELMADLDVSLSDLVKLVVYYTGDADDEAALLTQLADIIGHDTRPVISLINNPELCYPGMRVEIEGVAMRAPNGDHIPRERHWLDDMPALPKTFSHVLRAGGMIFASDISARNADGTVAYPGDLPAQSALTMQRLSRVMQTVGADTSDIVKVSTFYVGDGSVESWAEAATIRANSFANPGPAATGIPLPSFPHDDLMTKICATAVKAREGTAPLNREYSWPKGHWDWTTPLPYKHGNKVGNVIHLGGQVALNEQAEVLHPDDMVAQTRIAMDNIASVLAEFGATLDDVVKVTTFYQGSASAEALHENLLIRSASYTAPGPATTGVPVAELVYDQMVIEIEVIAIVE
ncbi:MAG: RidA family protein [Pikeienuella sp.]